MKTIVMIEDNELLLDNISEILMLSNYHVFCALDGAAGLALVLETNPDLIICDMCMPKMNGIDVLKALTTTKLTPACPFVFMTSKPDSFMSSLNVFADGYIGKPFLPEDLLKKIETVFATRSG